MYKQIKKLHILIGVRFLTETTSLEQIKKMPNIRTYLHKIKTMHQLDREIRQLKQKIFLAINYFLWSVVIIFILPFSLYKMKFDLDTSLTISFLTAVVVVYIVKRIIGEI